MKKTKMVKMLAGAKGTRYGNRRYEPDEPFEATEKESLLLVATGLARRADADAEVNGRNPSRKRVYRRRDMVAEGSQ